MSDLAAKREAKKQAKKNKPKVTPEYIAEQRRLAQIRKEQKLAQQQQNPSPSKEPSPEFVRRPVLQLSEDAAQNTTIKIMTYNVLAQALIRRTLFPTSGEALKWPKRSKVLLAEIKYYDPDIMCLQEVDCIQFESFWRKEFEQMGYFWLFESFPSKNHGVAIIYREKYFKKASIIKKVLYDDVATGDVLPRTQTRNVGLIAAIELQETVKARRKGFVVGTHHLFWHPHGTFERTRQTYAALKLFHEFFTENGLSQNQYYSFFCGDFNAEPYHSPYLSMTRKPVYYDDVAKSVIEDSVQHLYDDGPEEKPQDSEVKPKYTAAAEGAPKGVPTTKALSLNTNLIDNLIDLHNQLPVRAISLYSVGYKQVHPENLGYRNEPDFSNWAHTWRGLLDYILVVAPWDISTNKQEVDTIEELEEYEGIKIKGLLRMPPRSEMPEEGLPKTDLYGSDHLCMMAVVELL